MTRLKFDHLHFSSELRACPQIRQLSSSIIFSGNKIWFPKMRCVILLRQTIRSNRKFLHLTCISIYFYSPGPTGNAIGRGE